MYNVVYSLQCLICNKQYIGETSTTLRERMNHHRSAIVNYNKDSGLNLHLAMHQDNSDIKFNKYNMESFTLTPIEAKNLDWNGKHFGSTLFRYTGTTRTKQE